MNKNKIILSAALAGLLLGSTNCAKFTSSKESEVGHCQGVNSCKGQGDCGGKGHGCAGLNSCKGKGWIRKTEIECESLKGNFES